jgi:DNA-binding transcriptional ArsR family regulator
VSPDENAIEPEAVAAARETAPESVVLLMVAETFQALADPTRLRILYALADRELCVRDISLVVGVSESAVSHQLRMLRERRLVRARRQGTHMYYAVDDHHLPALVREAEYHVDHVRSGIPDHPYP